MKIAAVLLFGLLAQDVDALETQLRSSSERDRREAHECPVASSVGE